MSQELDNLMLDTEIERKAIRIAKSIEKKFKELSNMGVSAVLNLDGGGVGLLYLPTSISTIARDSGHIDTGFGGFEHGHNYDDYVIHHSQIKNVFG